MPKLRNQKYKLLNLIKLGPYLIRFLSQQIIIWLLLLKIQEKIFFFLGC